MLPIVWWEPWKASCESAVTELRSTGWFGWAFWMRVLVVSTLLTAAAIAAILVACPGAALPWPQIAAVLLTVPPFLFVAGSAQLLMPVRIEVRSDRIMISKGQSTLLLKPDRVLRALITTDTLGDWLELEYTSTSDTTRAKRIRLSDRVDREALGRLLAELTRSA